MDPCVSFFLDCMFSHFRENEKACFVLIFMHYVPSIVIKT